MYHIADVRLEGHWIEASDNWLHKERTKPPLIQHVGHLQIKLCPWSMMMINRPCLQKFSASSADSPSARTCSSGTLSSASPTCQSKRLIQILKHLYISASPSECLLQDQANPPRGKGSFQKPGRHFFENKMTSGKSTFGKSVAMVCSSRP